MDLKHLYQSIYIQMKDLGLYQYSRLPYHKKYPNIHFSTMSIIAFTKVPLTYKVNFEVVLEHRNTSALEIANLQEAIAARLVEKFHLVEIASKKQDDLDIVSFICSLITTDIL